MKKFLSVIIILISFCFCISAKNVNALAEVKQFSSKAVYLCDFNSGTVLQSKNENERLTIASMCKIMTLLLIFEEIESGNLTLDEAIPVSEKASGMGGSQAFLETGGEYTASELIKSIVIASANDSCVAFAERICGSEADFVQRMNDRAKELEMNNTLFSNCTGLPKPTQYSCAKDVAIMFSELLKHEGYFNYSKIWMDEIKHPEGRVTGLTNTNKLIRAYEGCDGGKTGFTSESGHCLASTAKRGSMRLVSVIISAPDSKTRFYETSELFNYGFANFTNKLIVDSSVPLNVKAECKGGVIKEVEAVAAEDMYIFSGKGIKDEFRLEFIPKEKLCAPISKGDVIGHLEVYRNNEQIRVINCLAFEDVSKKPFIGFVKDVLSKWAV